MKRNLLFKTTDYLWELWCLATIIGWWPRYIEPRFLTITRREHVIPHLSPLLEGLRILHFSDLHFQESMSSNFLNRIIKKVKKLSPDLILFTGDFLCYSQLVDRERLEKFLASFSAPYGCYACLGNHDYNVYITKDHLNRKVIQPYPSPLLIKLWERLTHKQVFSTSLETIEMVPHEALISLINRTAFQVLENQTALVDIKGALLNIVGLGDLWLERFSPEVAFKEYDNSGLGIILSHNPETFHSLLSYPGDLIFSGHTHGGQVNLPGVWKWMYPQRKSYLRYGLYEQENKSIFITRGVGSHLPFRWFSPPEITLLTLKQGR